MKCPSCGKWNSASMPHCKYCGQPLEIGSSSTSVPSWQKELDSKPQSRIWVDELGQEEEATDKRDSLANEMVELRRRKQEGEEKQRKLREQSMERGFAPSGSTVRTTSQRETFFSSTSSNSSSMSRETNEIEYNGENQRNDEKLAKNQFQSTRQQINRTRGYNTNEYSKYNINSNDYLEEGIQSIDYINNNNFMPNDSLNAGFQTSKRYKTEKFNHHRIGIRRILLVLLIASFVVFSVWLTLGVIIPAFNTTGENAPEVTITSTIRDDLAAHTITIPGEEGQRITIRELRTSAIVIGGVATFDILDHTWYDSYENYLQESMTVTLSPYIISDSGKQEPLEQISYTIDIPLSPIELVTPDSPYTTVSTALYTIVLYVNEGSEVYINGTDYSDLVDTDDGKVSYNATVQPIGENVFDITVRSQYCRENSTTVTLYREKQEIPLDLSTDISSTSSSDVMEIRATTLPGAVINVLSPYSDLDITTTDTDGSFSFNALFDEIGNNTIIITADYPGKKQTKIEYTVYYVPSVDIYSRKAWDVVSQYNDLVDNNDLRKSQHQIYVCIGTITSIETTKPQRAMMECTTADGTAIVYVENSTKTTWEEGVEYRLYADAYGLYSGYPWLIARYTYDP